MCARGTLVTLARHKGTGLARRSVVYWSAAARCCRDRTSARSQWNRDIAHRKGPRRNHGHVADPAGAATDARRWPSRRPCLHLRPAEEGATVAQLNAIFGWRGTAMASLYTEAADRKRLAVEAMALVAGRTEIATSMPSPSHEVRAIISNRIFCSGAAERTRTSTSCDASTSS